MKLLICDVETSGLSNNHSILEFSYVEMSEDLSVVYDSDILYFYSQDTIWDAEASRINGLNQFNLRPFKDEYDLNVAKMYKKVTQANFVGHNVSFDIRHVVNALSKNRYGSLKYNENFTFDTMKIFQPVFNKRMKLSELVRALNISEKQIEFVRNIWFKGKQGVNPGWHSASYDVTATGMIFLEALKRKLVVIDT